MSHQHPSTPSVILAWDRLVVLVFLTSHEFLVLALVLMSLGFQIGPAATEFCHCVCSVSHLVLKLRIEESAKKEYLDRRRHIVASL